jgi:hypothetical protein
MKTSTTTQSDIIQGRRIVRTLIDLLRDARNKRQPDEEYLKTLRKIIPLRNGNNPNF